jgi:hypothetical protein
MSARKRTSLEAVFGAEEPPAVSPTKHAQPEAPVRTAETEDHMPHRDGEPKRPTVKQHTAYLPLPVHSLIAACPLSQT